MVEYNRIFRDSLWRFSGSFLVIKKEKVLFFTFGELSPTCFLIQPQVQQKPAKRIDFFNKSVYCENFAWKRLMYFIAVTRLSCRFDLLSSKWTFWLFIQIKGIKTSVLESHHFWKKRCLLVLLAPQNQPETANFSDSSNGFRFFCAPNEAFGYSCNRWN